MTFATPREGEIDQRKAARTKRQPDRIAVNEVAETERSALLRDLALLGEHVHTDRSPNGMLNALLQRDEVRPAKSIVGVAAQQPLAVDVGSAERRLKVKRHAARPTG